MIRQRLLRGGWVACCGCVIAIAVLTGVFDRNTGRGPMPTPTPAVVAPPPPGVPAASAVPEVAPSYVTALPIGPVPDQTRIRKSDPAGGGQNVLILIHPCIAPGQTVELGESSAKLIGRFSSLLLVRVESSGGVHRIAGLEGAACVQQGDEAIAANSASADLNLSFEEGLVLNFAISDEKKKTAWRVSDHCVIVDVPALQQLEGQHVPVNHRFAVLLDRDSGALSTLHWGIATDSSIPTSRICPVSLMDRGPVWDAALAVDNSQITFGIPSSTAMAFTGYPSGRPLSVQPVPADDELLNVTIDDRTRADRLERRLRELLERQGP